VLGTTLSSIPAAVPYLAAPAARRARFAVRATSRPRIGVAWSGNAANPRDGDRSIPLAAFAAALPPGVEVHSLQRDVRPADAALLATIADFTHHGEALADFADTAALIESMDLVVTVDTAVAHVAGALGKPAWIVVSHVPDWRWLLDRDDSPWYPSVRLFRQRAAGREWGEVLGRVREALQDWLPAIEVADCNLKS
jgi:hypothetical protein